MVLASVTPYLAICESRDSTRNKTAGNFSLVRTSRLISAANFIFGASRANDSASTVSPQCSRGGPDSDTAEKRKIRAKIRAWSRARASMPGGNHVAAVEIGILIGDETKIAVARGYTSLLKRVLQRRRFASNAERYPFKLRDLCDFRLQRVSKADGTSYSRARISLWHCVCRTVLDIPTLIILEKNMINNKLNDDELGEIRLDCKMTFVSKQIIYT